MNKSVINTDYTDHRFIPDIPYRLNRLYRSSVSTDFTGYTDYRFITDIPYRVNRLYRLFKFFIFKT